jgi:predicted XRE-type DNA-binding protein
VSRSVTVRVSRDDELGVWVALGPRGDGLALQHRSLAALLVETDEMAQDWYGEPITIVWRFPRDLARAVDEVTQARRRADQAEEAARDAVQRAVATLAAADLSQAEAASLLGLSRQRIGQLLAANR